jgi:NDP-hexose-3-ketoreductase
VHVLIIGYSSIVRRRVLHALRLLPKVDAVDIASRRGVEAAELPANWVGDLYADYSRALERSHATLAYISLVNSLHEEWAIAALRSGRHVVVDKPAFPSLATTEYVMEVADRERLCVAEATVFADHPQFDMMRHAVEENGGVNRLVAVFSFPPFPPSNFRNHPELGGGALLDLGPYAAAQSRLFFTSAPREAVCRVISRHPETSIDTAFTVMATYTGARSFVGHFGFDTEYQNRITALGPGIAITLERVFTTSPVVENQLFISRRSEQLTVTCPAGDTFARFFARVIKAIEASAWQPLSRDMHEDAMFRERMRVSAEEGER